MDVIVAEALSKVYQDKCAVDSINLNVREGIIFGMLGPNGAGKSTTIESLIGIKKRTSGFVEVLGIDPMLQPKEIFKNIGVQLQETSYQENIKVRELCDFFSSMYENPIDYEPLLKRFNLEEKRNALVTGLSGGQRQKVAIILALIANPKVVFLDELTTGLDPKARREMWAYIKGLKEEGRTVFLTTHYMEEAAFLCDQICIIDEGRVIANGSVDQVIEQSNLDTVLTFEIQEGCTIDFSKEISGISELETQGNRIRIASKKESILTDVIICLNNKSVRFGNFNIQNPCLEEAYLKLTGKKWEAKA